MVSVEWPFHGNIFYMYCSCTYMYSTRQKSCHSVPSRRHSDGVNMTVRLPSRDRRNSKHGTLAHFLFQHWYTCTLNTVSFVCVCKKTRPAFQPGMVQQVMPHSSHTLH